MSAMTLDALAERLDRLEKLLLAGAVEEVRTLNVTEVCRLTGLSRKAVLAAIRTEDLPSIEFGERTKVVRPHDLDLWIESHELRG